MLKRTARRSDLKRHAPMWHEKQHHFAAVASHFRSNASEPRQQDDVFSNQLEKRACGMVRTGTVRQVGKQLRWSRLP
jgi:hypothetical protein